MKKNVLFAAALALAVTATTAFAQEDYATWAQTSNITVNTSVSGLNVPSNVLKFPYLVKLDSTFNFTQSMGLGADVRFSKTNGTVLPYELERWDSAGKRAYFWVLLDTVYGNNATQAFRIHWGKAGAADSSKATAVFDTANGFQVVYHMNEASGNVGNSTLRPYIGVNKGTPGTTSVTGAIGRGRNFNATNTANEIVGQNWIEVTNNGTASTNLPGLNMTTGSATLSAWVRNTTHNFILGSSGNGVSEHSFHNIIAKRDRLYLRTAPFYNSDPVLSAVEVPRYEVGVASVERVAFTVPQEDANTLNWIHLVGVKDEATQLFYLYRNGVAVGEYHTTPYVDVEAAATRWSLGAYTTGDNTDVLTENAPGELGGRVWIGDMDEVRIQNKARSAAWVKLEWMNQKSAVALVKPVVAYTPATLNATVGVEVEKGIISTGGVVDAYSVAPPLPAGLALSTTTGLITGTPTAASASTTYTITATGPGGSSTATLNATVVSLRDGQKVARTVTMNPLGKGFAFHFPDASAKMHVAILDVAGRAVWTQTSKDASTLVWNGVSNDGSQVRRGVYTVRVTLLGEAGNTTVLNRTISYAP